MNKRDDVRFLHYRSFEYQEGPDGEDIEVVSPREGATVAYVQEGNHFRYAIAYCGQRDNFNRRIGRSISRGRLLNDSQSFVTDDLADRASFSAHMDDVFEESWGYYRR
jgi:hypothetical protein